MNNSIYICVYILGTFVCIFQVHSCVYFRYIRLYTSGLLIGIYIRIQSYLYLDSFVCVVCTFLYLIVQIFVYTFVCTYLQSCEYSCLRCKNVNIHNGWAGSEPQTFGIISGRSSNGAKEPATLPIKINFETLRIALTYQQHRLISQPYISSTILNCTTLG